MSETKQASPRGRKPQSINPNEMLTKLVQHQKEQRAKIEKQMGKVYSFSLLDKRRRDSGNSDIYEPKFSIEIPHDEPFIDVDGEQVSGSVTVRYARGQRSLFAHKQNTDEKITLDTIEFINGGITANSKTQESLFKFLTLNPYYDKCPYPQQGVAPHWKLDNEEDAMEQNIEREAQIYKLVERVIGMDEEEVYKFSLLLGFDVSLRPEFLKNLLKKKAEEDPNGFTNVVEDPYADEKNVYIMAKSLGVINASTLKMTWSNGSEIYSFAKGIPILDQVAKYFRTDEGAVVLDEIRNRLNSLE